MKMHNMNITRQSTYYSVPATAGIVTVMEMLANSQYETMFSSTACIVDIVYVSVRS